MAELSTNVTETPRVEIKNKLTVIVAVDHSDHAEYAFDWYVNHLHKPENYVIVIHVPEHLTKYVTSGAGIPSFYGGQVSPYVSTINAGEIQRMIIAEKQETEEMLAKYVRKLKEAKIQGDYKTLHSNRPGFTIVEAAQDLHADTIVMGTRGMGIIRRTIMGSISDYVMHHAHVPIVVCRH